MLLSKATYSHVCIHSTYGWSRESNPLPWHYKRHALPTELQKDIIRCKQIEWSCDNELECIGLNVTLSPNVFYPYWNVKATFHQKCVF